MGRPLWPRIWQGITMRRSAWNTRVSTRLKNNVRDDELTPKRLLLSPLGQYDQTSKLIDSNANRGLVIADTNSLVTKATMIITWRLRIKRTYQEKPFDNLFVSRILAKEKMGLDSLCNLSALCQ